MLKCRNKRPIIEEDALSQEKTDRMSGHHVRNA